MDVGTFDGLLRRAADAIDRRQSLRVLGAGALGLSAARAGDAGAAKAGNKAKKKCRRQRGQCLGFVQRRCTAIKVAERDPGAGAAEADPVCVAQFNPCCEFFATCQAKAALECLMPRRQPPAE